MVEVGCGWSSMLLARAIERSCNVYFYQLGARVGFRDLVEYGSRVGGAAKPLIALGECERHHAQSSLAMRAPSAPSRASMRS